MNKILLVRTDRIGDVVSITPAITVLRKSFPGAHIAALVSPYTSDVLANNPHINEIITDKPLFQLVPELKAKKFDTCVVFFVNFHSAAAPWLAGIPRRIGPASKIWSVFLSERISQHRSKVLRHEADFNLDLLLPLGAEIFKTGPYINVPEKDGYIAKEYLGGRFAIPETSRLIIMHPGSKGSARNWPAENFAKLASLAMDSCKDIKILFTGGNEQELALIKDLAEKMPKKPAFIRETLPLSQFIALIGRASVVVTNSTGPLHLATATGVRTVSFFPPIVGCLPQRWGPYGKGHIVLKPLKEPCKTCTEKCPDFDCMNDITPETALAALKQQLYI